MKTFLALFMGDPAKIGQQPQMDDALMAKGMAAWGGWMAEHAAIITDRGGPLGLTKKIDKDGVADIRNAVGGFVVLQAESQEAAAQLFLNHPHFAIFPGKQVEVMEVLAIPGM